MPKYKNCRAFITGLGCSVPKYRFSQEKVGLFMKRHMASGEGVDRWVDRLVKQSGIDTRYSVLEDYALDPTEFTFFPRNNSLEPFPPVSKRMACYKLHAASLGADAARECLSHSEVFAAEVTHLITVSCTGMYAPGLDMDLIQRLGLPTTVERTCINFMGCYAAFNALKVAARITAAQADARVLIVCVELCSIHFQKQGVENKQLLSNMLFGDGASAVMVEGRAERKRPSLALRHFCSDIFPEGKDDMTWDISDSGFVMKLTSSVSSVLREGVGKVLERLFEEAGCVSSDVRHYVFHPGGPRVLNVLEEVCGLTTEDTRWSYGVLRDYGNMSSATLFFVLEMLFRTGSYASGDLILSAAFGPGLTCESALMQVVA
jgi:predicted naringenin-chalcone synthase